MLRLCVLIGMLSAALCGSDRQLLPGTDSSTLVLGTTPTAVTRAHLFVFAEHSLKDVARAFGVSEAAVLGTDDTCTGPGHACPAITRLSRHLNRYAHNSQ